LIHQIWTLDKFMVFQKLKQDLLADKNKKKGKRETGRGCWDWLDLAQRRCGHVGVAVLNGLTWRAMLARGPGALEAYTGWI
jgi:hypothetical protein